MKKSDLRFLYQSDFLAFASKAVLELDGTRIKMDQYIELLATKAMDFANGDSRRLCVNLPPRHLKTHIFAVCLPAWILGHSPTTKIMLLSCSEELAEETARKIRSVMTAGCYREVFATRIKKGQAKATNFSTTAGGGVFSASIHSNFTGRGAGVTIIDDLHPITDAGKPQKLTESIELFQNFIMSRRNNPRHDRILVIGHRISEKDIFARLRTEKRWTSIILPLVATRNVTYETAYGTWHRRKGDLLRPDAFDEDEIEHLKKTYVNPDFEMLYQQDCDGQARFAITAEHFPTAVPRDYDNLPTVLSIEPGVSDGDNASFSVIQVWAFDEVNFYLVDQFREQCDFYKLIRAARKLKNRYRPEAILIEKTANGPALISELNRMRKFRRLIVPITPRGSKSFRFNRHIDKIRGGHVWLREYGTFCDEFIDELVAFHHGAYSDQVDAFTQAADWIDKNRQLATQPRKDSRQLPIVIATGQPGALTYPSVGKPDAPGFCVVRGNSSAPWRRRW